MTHEANTHAACRVIEEIITNARDGAPSDQSKWEQVRWFWCLNAATEFLETSTTLKSVAQFIADNDWPTVPNITDTESHVRHALDELAWLEGDDEQAYTECVKSQLKQWGWK